MYDSGFKHIINIDFSKIVISLMQEKYSEYSSTFKCKIFWRIKLKDMVMDCTELEFSDGEFDVVIDKGTLDSILVNLIRKKI